MYAKTALLHRIQADAAEVTHMTLATEVSYDHYIQAPVFLSELDGKAQTELFIHSGSAKNEECSILMCWSGSAAPIHAMRHFAVSHRPEYRNFGQTTTDFGFQCRQALNEMVQYSLKGKLSTSRLGKGRAIAD